MAVTRIQFTATCQFIKWSMGRPLDIQAIYDDPSESDALALDGQQMNFPDGVAWVHYRDGTPLCAVIVSACNVFSVSHRLCLRDDRLALVRALKRAEKGLLPIASGWVQTFADWEELFVHRHNDIESADAVLRYFGFHNLSGNLYRRSAAKLE